MYKANRPLPSVGSIPAVQTRWASKTQPNAVASGIRLLARSEIDYPAVGALLLRLGGAGVRDPELLLDFVRRDLAAGIRPLRFALLQGEHLELGQSSYSSAGVDHPR